MRVLIAAASFAQAISGVQRHAMNLARCLLLTPELAELHFVAAPWQCNLLEQASLPSDARLSTHIVGMKYGSLDRNLWYYRRLPELAAQLKADLVHLSYPVPLNAQAFTCPTVVTLHDLYPYEIPMNFGFAKFIFNRMVLRQCLLGADAIACVSEATQLSLNQYASPDVNRKATRIYNCVEPGPQQSIESPIPGPKNAPFLLCVAQHRRNKNIPTLIYAFDRMLRSGRIGASTKLVVVGIRGPETVRIHRAAADSRVSGNIHFLEGLSEAELQWCYRQCEALVAPSLTEGFGLPVAEGILAGCRIVCSDIPAHREIGDAHCRFVALRENDADDLAAAIGSILSEPKPQPAALPHLSAPVIAEQYLALYRRLIDSVAPVRAIRLSGSKSAANAEATAIANPDGQSALACRGK